jgi:hypothetical protein
MDPTTANFETAPLVAPARSSAASSLLVSLCPLPVEALQTMLENLSTAFPGESILVATPDAVPDSHNSQGLGTLHLIPYSPATPVVSGWALTAADYLNTYKLMQEYKATVCLLLGTEAQSLTSDALRALAGSALVGTDLTMARYELGPLNGLVNSAILYPVTRALFGTRARYPLSIDLALSERMAERLAIAAQSFTVVNQTIALLWPLAEAAVAGFSIAEVSIGPRSLPQPDDADLNSLLTLVAGSFFTDIDAKAAFWQRARLAYSSRNPSALDQATSLAPSAVAPDIPGLPPMLDYFRLAYTNLHEIWSLVLPPNSLLGLKKLSQMPSASFRMSDTLWTHIIYDFILAYRLRTLNRGHLIGALTPLYLAWVASHLLMTTDTAITPESHVEALAAAFETDKPYLVSRWRWPDRFNP